MSSPLTSIPTDRNGFGSARPTAHDVVEADRIVRAEAYSSEISRRPDLIDLAREMIDGVVSRDQATLANFDEPELPHLVDPSRHLLDGGGRLKAPAVYRGQRTTGVRDDWVLTGPVQPVDGFYAIIRNAWPDDVREACEQIAEMKLPRRLIDAAWRAIDPESRGVTHVGVQKAA